MAAGDNTLEALLVRRTASVCSAQGGTFAPSALLEDYVRFMTTPDTHNDTYCGTCHRMFFANRAGGAALKDCPDNDAHNVDSADALVTTVPVALLAADDARAEKECFAMVQLTRRSPDAGRYASAFSAALRTVARGAATASDAAAAFSARMGLRPTAGRGRRTRSPPDIWGSRSRPPSAWC